ncbi:hypothetical protein Y032_0119g822 [Ancylostoma ceylanicum]|uniref:SCP domain-containing protein n=1 Tax=Ancylostoma ceylanicum TaxID=53326 RepID=A0A016TB48_9BILA|nr:hypothetical protein Y032_0119g822 [Ancylostoma ceylanicum]
MWSFSLGVLLIIVGVTNDVSALTVPNEFKCKNTLISDEWRKMVLKFHNDNRRKVVEGKQPTKDSKYMPIGKNINELVRYKTLMYLIEFHTNLLALTYGKFPPPISYNLIVEMLLGCLGT